MKIFCMSDIHGHLDAFEDALKLVLPRLDDPDTKLLLMGDYIHDGPNGRRVIDRIIGLQEKYGAEKVMALLGNHEDLILWKLASIDDANMPYDGDSAENKKYVHWMSKLPRYYSEGNTIFVHAGIDEEAGDLWEWGTSDEIFTGKFPAETGKIEGIDMKVVAGHIGTSSISGDPDFHDIFYDGASHYYIDGTVSVSGVIPVMMVDTEKDKYYKVMEKGFILVLPYVVNTAAN